MMSAGRGARVVPMRVFLIASAVTAGGASLVAGERLVAQRRSRPAEVRVALADVPDHPIPGEAGPFRTRVSMFAIDPAEDPGRPAHPRSLATYRSLRAYAGAPPRIPHGLTPAEFQTGGCRTCHERGGFSQRFGAYVPLTPHPELGACLQCHVGDAQLMAIPLPGLDPSARCRQCHAPGATRWRDSSVNWIPLAWPRATTPTKGRNPPPIPHALVARGNCLACHAAPSGVAEIRTSHPERANCRQCHLAAGPGSEEFTRPSRGVSTAAGATP